MRLPILTNEQLHLIGSNIVRSEGINIDSDAYDYLIKISNSSVRLVTNYLEKMKILNERITISLVHEICSNINYSFFEEFIKNCKDGDVRKASDILYTLSDRGFSVMDILDCYFTFIKMTDLLDENLKYKIIKLICKYITIFNTIHESEIELTLFTYDLINTVESI